MEVPPEQTNRYGVLDPVRDDGRLVEVKGLVEKPDPAEAPSRLAVIGRYILLPQVFDHLSMQQKGAGGEIQLTDAMARMIGRAAVPRPALRRAGGSTAATSSAIWRRSSPARSSARTCATACARC